MSDYLESKEKNSSSETPEVKEEEEKAADKSPSEKKPANRGFAARYIIIIYYLMNYILGICKSIGLFNEFVLIYTSKTFGNSICF